jgi:hypothetical protein
MYEFQARRDVIAAIVMVGLAAFAMLVPVETFSTSPHVANSLRLACSYMPFPCHLASKAGLPSIVQSALLLSLVGAFLAAPSYLYWFMKGKSFDAVRGNKKIMATGWMLLILALFPFCPGGARTSISRLELVLLIATQSRIGLGMFSVLFFIGELSFLLCCAVWLKCLLTKGYE